MFDSLEKATNIIKNICVSVFFVTLIFVALSVNRTLTVLSHDITETKNTVLSEISLIRRDLFQTTILAINKVDTRISSIEDKTFKKLEDIESKTFLNVEKVNSNLDKITEETIALSKEYKALPQTVIKSMDPINARMDCTYNDSCWPNLFTDVLIDSRNVARAGSSSFLLVNREIPKITKEIAVISKSISEEIPKITENATKITENATNITSNIDRLTKPKWYDRLISTAASGSLIWFNLSK